MEPSDEIIAILVPGEFLLSQKASRELLEFFYNLDDGDDNGEI